jgi:hypothetical protein
MTLEEIAANRDKVNGYLSEAISALYDQNMIDHNIMLGLGNKINSLYASQIELKQMLGAFVNKLNQKIVSIDNFHMLTEEINQHVYTSDNRMAAICKVGAQLDGRTVNDQRKMDILMRAMEQNGIIVNEEETLVSFLTDLLEVNDSDAGLIAMMLDNSKSEYIVEIANDVIREFYFMPEKIRKMKNRKAIVESILNEKQIDLSYTIASSEIYTTLIGTIANNIVVSEQAEIEDQVRRKYESLMQYFDDIKGLAYGISNLKEYIYWPSDKVKLRKDAYNIFLENVKANCCPGSLYRKKIKEAMYAIETFLQVVYEKYPDLYQGDECMNATGLKLWDEKLQLTGADIHLSDGVDVLLTGAYNYCQKIDNEHGGFCNFLNDEGFSWKWGFSTSDTGGTYLLLDYFGKNIEFFCDSVKEMIGDNYSNYSDLYDLVERYSFDTEYSYFKPNMKEVPNITFTYNDEEESLHSKLFVNDDINCVRVKVKLLTEGNSYGLLNANCVTNPSSLPWRWDNDLKNYIIDDSIYVSEASLIFEKNSNQSWSDSSQSFGDGIKIEITDQNNPMLKGDVEVNKYQSLDSTFAEFDNMFADINNMVNEINSYNF